jgi:hypothetical protein
VTVQQNAPAFLTDLASANRRVGQTAPAAGDSEWSFDMPMQKVGSVSLKNSGGFVARIQFSYLDEDGNKQLTGQSGDVLLGQTLNVDPGDLGVPDGSWIYLHAFVVWGTDNEAKRAFVYEKGKNTTARYNISGTTLANDLGLIDVN